MLDIDKELKWRLLEVDNLYSDYTDRDLLFLNMLNSHINRSKVEELKNIFLLCSFVIVIMLCWILLVVIWLNG